MATTLSSTNGKRELKMEFESLFQAPERASEMFLSSFFSATVRPPFFPTSSSESKRLGTREKKESGECDFFFTKALLCFSCILHKRDRIHP